jgi:hypothetical protein
MRSSHRGSKPRAAWCPPERRQYARAVDLVSLFPTRLAAAGVSRCALQMLRLESPGFFLSGTVMSDLSLVRYRGFANLPEAGALRRRLEQEQPAHLRHGIHLIIAQGSDGSLVAGDSHHYDAATESCADEAVYDLLHDEFRAVIGQAPPAVRGALHRNLCCGERPRGAHGGTVTQNTLGLW